MRGSGIGLCSNTITTECTVQKEHDTTKKRKERKCEIKNNKEKKSPKNTRADQNELKSHA